MADRALIVAIENYDHATDGFTAKKLDGTLDAAKAFRSWLEDKWRGEGVSGSVLFCSEPRLPGQLGAGNADIVDALIKLEEEGRDATENLFVYFSGHGFRAIGETIKLADVLVCADFRDLQRSAAACFKLDALVAGLRGSLGRGCHFYFIDACRNEVPRAVMSNIMPFSGRGSEEPSVFVLQSTVAGAPSLVGGPFAKLLVQGLRGAGKAKVWEPPATDSMKVRFDSLRKFLKEGLQDIQPITQTTNGEKGESDAVLATIRPVVPNTLTLTVNTTEPAVTGVAMISAFGGAPQRHAVSGKALVIDLPPNYYTVTLSLDALSVTPSGTVDVDLYENRELVFVVDSGAALRGAPRAAPRLDRRTNVRLSVPVATHLLMRHMGTGQESVFDSSVSAATLSVGTYRATLRSSGGQVISVDEVTVDGASPAEIAPADWQGNVARESIARHFPQRDGGIDFSKSLGAAITDPDLSVWLAILGGARVLGSSGDDSMRGPLPLADFSGEPAGASPVYVLAGLPDAHTSLRVGVGNGRTPPAWADSRQPPGLEGVREAVFHPSAGQWFVTLAIGRQPASTLTSFSLPNRCTLIVLTLDEDGQPRIAQYLLPLGHLTRHLEPGVQAMLASRNQLKDVHVLALLGRTFRKRRKIKDEFKEHELDALLWSKWLDPIGASLATYECARRNNADPQTLAEVARNMRTYFGDLPDTAAIVRLAGKDEPPPYGVPLFLDGLRAFKEGEIALPYPASLLDFTGPWTCWRGAVENRGRR